jgi:hypothetical protein
MRKLLLFTFVVLLPAVVVGISNLTVFPDSAWAATIMLVVTVGVAAVFTWQSGNATAKISRYCICADFVIAAILCVNLGSHWLLAREVSAARQGVAERHAEEDREDRRKAADAERQLAPRRADAELAKLTAALQNAERRRPAQSPPEQRRPVLGASPTPKPPSFVPVEKVAPYIEVAFERAPVTAPVTAPKLTPEQVRDSWWWRLTALAFAECFASVLAGAILAGIWEWDRNHDGIADHLQKPGKK